MGQVAARSTRTAPTPVASASTGDNELPRPGTSATASRVAGQRPDARQDDRFPQLGAEEQAARRSAFAGEHEVRAPAGDEEDRGHRERARREHDRAGRRHREDRFRGCPLGLVPLEQRDQATAERDALLVGRATRAAGELGRRAAEVGHQRIELPRVEARLVEEVAPVEAHRQAGCGDVCERVRRDQCSGECEWLIDGPPQVISLSRLSAYQISARGSSMAKMPVTSNRALSG